MRVLLPLKKKLNDANELHDEDDEFDDESLLQLVEVDGEVFHAASPESSDSGAQVLAEAWTQVVPEAAYLASASSNNKEGPTTSAVPFCHGSVVGDSQSAKADLVAVGITTQHQQPTDDNERVCKKDSRTTNNTCTDASADETGTTTIEPAQSTSTVAAIDSLYCNSEFASNNQSTNPESAAKSTGAEHADPLLATATLPVCSVSTVLPPPNAASATAVPLLTTYSRLRKRRSNSPPGSPADSKPPSKKGRDTKPPARDTAPSALFSSSNRTSSSNNNNNNMAGGGNSRGGRKLWTSGSPYYVESNAGTGGAGREDFSNNSDDSAELYVRFAYRHENDPASARGDAPSPTVRAPPVASTNHLGSGVVVPKRRATNKRANNAGLYAACGRDDDDEREREVTVDRPEPDEDHFALMLKKQGLEIVEQEGDGNCLFRAISLQVYGDASMHGEVRHRCLDFMARDKEHFSQFITDEPFEQYIQRKRQDGVHGNNPEIQAISELFNRPIEVFVPENGATPLNIFHAEYKTQDAPIRLSYHDGNHYNAVIDPLVPTAGLGLGLPGLQPGLADKLQMAKAVAESDRMADQREFERALEESQNDQLQRAIKESTLTVDHMFQNKALSLSDCDATNFELEQAVLESSLESFRMYEHGRKQASSTTTRSASVANGRRKHDNNPGSAAAGKLNSSVASMPEARQDSGPAVVPHAASVAVASVASASAPAVASRPSSTDGSILGEMVSSPLMAEHYPQTVQELVMNGFDLPKVVHAYELVGDNFDDLLAFLMSNSS